MEFTIELLAAVNCIKGFVSLVIMELLSVGIRHPESIDLHSSLCCGVPSIWLAHIVMIQCTVVQH